MHVRPLAAALLLSACAAEGAAPGTPAPAVSQAPQSPPAPPAAGTQKPVTPPAPDAGAPDAGAADAAADAEPVSFEVLAYNVAGLPEGVSGSSPLKNTPLISPRLNAFDLVLVQEDFTYHAALVASATHPYQSDTVTLQNQSDGLNTLSVFPFSAFTRSSWAHCNGVFDQGSDCLTKKGFTRAALDLGNGRTVDVYDVHFDAGRSDADYAARAKQVEQLSGAIAAQSAGHAVLVAGDTNMKLGDEPVFAELLASAGLACACRTLGCPEPERIDRILFRSGGGVTLEPHDWVVEHSFVDEAGAPLSDHAPVSVRFEAR